ncbi:hypothetical protein Poli38472_010436 [Pythium oligandrum]|uniref:Uncharacterized protein n=1 Tax=Pythium oligandrum TaxID=41045 RepID=A0A8K1C307_PYTOL|nr:hypothetical protein Poli38472_010436 [Pythium oligandrum]|eukprot:TMW55554.1 hypothetical protein Poli38472_010436 [Pythium oligandrum]
MSASTEADVPPIAEEAAALVEVRLPRIRSSHNDSTPFSVGGTTNHSEASTAQRYTSLHTPETTRTGGLGEPVNTGPRRTMAQPLGHRIDLMDRCKWSAVIVFLYYIVTVLAWPSYLVTLLGVSCGLVGVYACRPPHTFGKVMWLLLYLWFNVVMVGCVGYAVVDSILGKSDLKPITAAFGLLAVIFHMRAVKLCRDVVRKARVMRALAEVFCCGCYFRRRRAPQAEPEAGRQVTLTINDGDPDADDSSDWEIDYLHMLTPRSVDR